MTGGMKLEKALVKVLEDEDWLARTIRLHRAHGQPERKEEKDKPTQVPRREKTPKRERTPTRTRGGGKSPKRRRGRDGLCTPSDDEDVRRKDNGRTAPTAHDPQGDRWEKRRKTARPRHNRGPNQCPNPCRDKLKHF